MNKKITGGILLLVMMFILTSCGSKVAISPWQFKTVMEDNGFSVIDSTVQFNDRAQKVYLAVNKKINCQLEYYNVTNKSQAQTALAQNKSIFQNSKDESFSESSVNGKNYGCYSLTTEGRYMYVCYVENTLVYVNTDKKNKGDVKDIIDELGY